MASFWNPLFQIHTLCIEASQSGNKNLKYVEQVIEDV